MQKLPWRSEGLADTQAAQTNEQAGSAPPAPADTPHVFADGEILSDTFAVVKLIGQGSMGQVYEAQDLALRRRVAVKALLPGYDPSLLRKEAQALAAIRHPGLITIHGLGRHRGVEYMVMERILGVTLEAHLEKRRAAGQHLSVAEASEILLALAGVLSAVHGAGVAHRDVKPSNIMLCPGDRLVLMDLGIVAPEVEMSREAPMVGTPYYMAPEAIRGQVASGSAHLLDIYALGVIAYELLAGALPYEGQTTPEVLDQHLNSPVPDVERHMPWVPSRLAQLVADCMAKDPQERPPAVEQVIWQLKAVQASAREPQSGEGLSILIVQADEQAAFEMTMTILRLLEGADVQTVRHVDRAVEAVRRREPDLLLVDVDLAEMNGVELCMYLRGTGLCDHAVLVAMASKASERDVEVLRTLGVKHALRKGPLLGRDLVKLLERVVPRTPVRARVPGDSQRPVKG